MLADEVNAIIAEARAHEREACIQSILLRASELDQAANVFWRPRHGKYALQFAARKLRQMVDHLIDKSVYLW